MENNVRRRRRDPAAGMPETQPMDQMQAEPRQELPMQGNRLTPAYQRRQATGGQMTQPMQPANRPAMEQSAYQRPAAQPVQPVIQPVQPQHRNMQPMTQPTQPANRPAMEQSAYQRPAVQPVTQPVQPQYRNMQPTQPANRPAMEQSAYQRPAAQPVQPVIQPVQPQYRNMQPMTQPTQPMQPTQPAVRQRRAAANPAEIGGGQAQRQNAYIPESVQMEDEPVQRSAQVGKTTKPKAAKKILNKKKEKPSRVAPAEPVNDDEPVRLAKKKWVAFFLCLFGGVFGLHKFYERKFFKGILYICTFGLAGFGVLIDLIKLLRKPTVYYIETKRRKPLLQAIRDFRFDIIGYIISGVGALIVSLTIITPELRGAVMSPLVGAGVMLAGAALSFVYTRELVKVLIINAVLLAGAFAFFFLWGLAIAIVVIEVVGLALGIDVFGTIVQLFSKDDDGSAGAIHSVQSIPPIILCDDGQRYHYVKGKAHASVYVGEQRKNTVTIHDNDINPGARSASVMDYVFRW